MSELLTTATTTSASTTIDAAADRAGKRRRFLLVGFGVFFLLALTRQLTSDAEDLTSSSTFSTVLRVVCPIMLAGLAGLWAERVGVLNIGIEGMMIFGTWTGAWGAWHYGPWIGFLCGIVGGAIGGLIHAVATVRFNVNHTISGVAINMLAFGLMRYFSELVFVGKKGGGISQSPPQKWAIPRFNVPFLAGGEIGGWKSPDALGWLEKRHWFLLGDAAGILRGLMFKVSWASAIAVAMVPLSAWILWRTRFGLRLRSSGEAPAAAESLGVKVTRLRYQALIISGGFAGFAGAFLSIVSSSYYRQGQTANRGFIGLATVIFGNYRPSGVLGGAGLFGFGEALQLVGQDALPKLFLFLAMIAGAAFVLMVIRGKRNAAIAAAIAAAVCGVLFAKVDEVPEPLTKGAPYVLTLVVLAVASQRLRAPSHAGLPYRSGDNH